MLETLAITCAAAGTLLTAYLASVFALAPPARALAQATHRAEMLPKVMANRYATFALFAGASALSRDPAVIAVTFAILAVPGFSDAVLYARAGHSHYKHLAAGLAALFVSALAAAAYRQGAV